ncbi:MAG: Wzz/FepE/Etk N-terminal domain-containing protein [Candidatus Omnitrophota bacterium]
MSTQAPLIEDEIDLRKYIEIIIKRKKFILGIFFVVVAFTAVTSFFQPKVYKATATLMITPSVIQSALSPTKGLMDIGKSDATGEKTSPWSISLATHVSLLKSNIVLERTVHKANLKDLSGKEVTIEDLSKKLNIKKATGENVIQLEATDIKPQGAKEIANIWAEQYVEYSQELVLGEVNGIGDFVLAQFEIAKKNLMQAEEAVNNFKKGYKQDLMSAELSMKKQALNSYKKELSGIELNLKTKVDALTEVKKQIFTQQKFTIISKAITDDALWQASSKKENSSEMDKKGLRSQTINPIYQDLETRIVNGEIDINTLKARGEYLSGSIESLTKETKEMENNSIQKDFELTQLTRQVDIAKVSYDAFSNKIQDARAFKAAQLGEVKIVSSASVPNYPANQGKMKRVALAGFLSLMFGVFLAFGMEFWKKGSVGPKNKK